MRERDIRAWVAAYLDWDSNGPGELDWEEEIAGEGLRALDGPERVKAMRFMDDVDLMWATHEAVRGDLQLALAFAEICPANGPAVEMLHHGDERGRTLYALGLRRRQRSVVKHLRLPRPTATQSPRPRPSAARARQSRASARRAAGIRAGTDPGDDDSGPSHPAKPQDVAA